MSMSDGKNRLMKICFQFGDRVFRFAINPDSYVHSKPHRTAVVKTKSRIYVQDFQDDIHTIKISGTTGWNPTGKEEDKGLAKIKEMKTFLDDYAKQGGNGTQPVDNFIFWNFTNEEYYFVHLSTEGVTFTQDVSQPLLYRYDIKFVVLTEVVGGSQIVSPILGNPVPTITNYTGKIGTNGLVYSPSNPNKLNTSTVSTNGLKYTPTYPQISSSKVSTNGLVYNPSYPQGYIPSSKATSVSSATIGATGGSGTFNQFKPYDTPISNITAINPQAPSQTAYKYGFTGLGLSIGYFGGSY
jgi:hypothetical protein